MTARARETLEVRAVPCACGKADLTVRVKVDHRGPLAFRVEEVSPCPACGSKDLKAAESKLATALEARTVRTKTVPCRCGHGEITLTVTEGHRGPVNYRAASQPTPCPACGSADASS